LALVAFAGGQAVACPLTVDHAFFSDALIDISPASVDRGGTRIGDAIRFVMERVFDDAQRGRRTLVILSDGEDHESAPQSAAEDAARAGVHVVTIGIGQEAGAFVPVSASDASPFLYQGQPVRSRLDAATLRAIVQDGAYLSDASEPGAIYRQWLAPAGRGTEATQASEAAWTVLLVIALVLLAVEQRRGLAAVLIVVLARPASAQTIEEWFNNGLAALDKQDYAEAMRYFGDAARWSPEQPEIRFNLAKALYGMKSYEEAALGFERAAAMSKDANLKAQARLGQGNAWFRHATEPSMRAIDRAIAGLRTSMGAYREALKIEPGLFAADINLKVAERKLRELLNRRQENQPQRDPSVPQPPPAQSQFADADQILRESRKTATPQALARGAAVDKDW
jgi:tetratricopeptide (TPR) repeat protein